MIFNKSLRLTKIIRANHRSQLPHFSKSPHSTNVYWNRNLIKTKITIFVLISHEFNRFSINATTPSTTHQLISFNTFTQISSAMPKWSPFFPLIRLFCLFDILSCYVVSCCALFSIGLECSLLLSVTFLVKPYYYCY